jgi:hypothetical protein
MPRGSRPGERRGGRKPGTPNKKTLTKNAVFLAAASDGERSPLDFMLALMRDRQVPLDLRIDMATAAAPFVHAKPEPARNKRPDPLDLRDRLGDTTGDLKFGNVEAKPGVEGSRGAFAIASMCGSSLSKRAWSAGVSLAMPITFALRRTEPWAEESATSSRSRSAGDIIASCIVMVTKPDGGRNLGSIRPAPPARYGSRHTRNRNQ